MEIEVLQDRLAKALNAVSTTINTASQTTNIVNNNGNCF